MSFPHLSALHLHSNARTRSISAENFTGEKGKGGMATEGALAFASRELGRGWKVSPCINLGAGETRELAAIKGSGIIQHIWITTDQPNWRKIVLRMYWDGEQHPSVEVPLGDFFAQCWNRFAQVSSIPVAVNPRGGMNCYWPMPFRSGARITIENITPDDLGMFFYQITYQETEVPPESAYLHASFRRQNPTRLKEPFTIVEGIRGKGHYVGTHMGWQANCTGWWGEGEIKFYMDGDQEWPTICGTGTEDYFGGAWGFEDPAGTYVTYTTPFLGFHQHVTGEQHAAIGKRFGLYRWHVLDPIYFQEDLRVTMQALGIGQERGGQGRYIALQDDLCATAFWYQSEPHAPFAHGLTDELLTIN